MTIFKVAFTLNGHLCDHYYDYMLNNKEKYLWEDSCSFADTLEYFSFSDSTICNARIILKSISSNKRYCMFISDFDEILKSKLFVDNKIIGNFCFHRRGNAQGIKFIFEKKT
ncbi:MAG TPA: hypothetical protein VHZ50_18760 [Puia sp.]|nr:hypothetical protein [Puia sp.]